MRDKKLKKILRARRTRKKIKGSAEKPRLSVFRSAKHIYAQIINDEEGKTLVSFSSLNIKNSTKLSKIDQARLVGKTIAKLAKKLGIQKIVFDRGCFKYHGRVKALAEAARTEGLKF